MSLRRIVTIALATSSILTGALLLSSETAVASTYISHPLEGSFGPEGVSGSFASTESLAVDQATGDVYVYDQGNGGVIYKFNAAGEPEDISATNKTNAITGVGGATRDEVEIAASSAGTAKGDLYFATGSKLLIYATEGAHAGEQIGELNGSAGEPWSPPCGVAVDPEGNVYVADYHGGGETGATIDKFVPTGEIATDKDYVDGLNEVESVCQITVDSEDSLYGAVWFQGPVWEYAKAQFGQTRPKGVSVTPPLGSAFELIEKTYAVAADASGKALYLDDGAEIEQDNYAREAVGVSGFAEISGSVAVAVNEKTGRLYASDGTTGRIDVFGPGVATPSYPAPGVVGSPTVSNVTGAGAQFLGTVNPEGSPTFYYFQYGETEAYGLNTTPANLGSGSSAEAVEPVDSGELVPGTTYHMRLVAISRGGTSYSPDVTFTTSPKTPPRVTTGAASNVSQNDATISATIDTEGLQTVYGFEIATNTEYGPPTGLGFLGAGIEEAPVSLNLTGLLPGATYHYRIEATTLDGTTYGADQTFTTSTYANAFVTPPAPLPFVATPAIVFPTGSTANTGKPTGKPKAKKPRGKKKSKKVGKKKAKARAKKKK
jgi:hypothetical protein